MSREAKEWVKCTRKSRKTKQGGIHVYVNSDVLFNAGIDNGVDLEVKQYGLRSNKVLLKFRIRKTTK